MRVFSGGGGLGAQNRYHLSFWRFFPQFYGTFWPNFEASCGVVTFSLVLKASQVVLGFGTPNSPFVLSGPNMAFSSSQNTTF